MIIRDLIAGYKAHKYSGYQKRRFKARQKLDRELIRLDADMGRTVVASIKPATLIEKHAEWADGKKFTTARARISLLRTLFGFGFVFLEDEHCGRLCAQMREMRFKGGKRRQALLTAEHAIAICREARRVGRLSIALAQAAAFDFGWRQKDVIGEYVPREEPGESDITPLRFGKWLWGWRWEEIDADLIVHHVTSKRQALSEPPIALAPMVVSELEAMFGAPLTRARLPERGAVIINEDTGWPYTDGQFRKAWRKIAEAAGVPREVFNAHSRAGAITDALNAGAPLAHVQQMAGHSKSSTTEGYNRNPSGQAASAMKARAKLRLGKAGDWQH